METKKYNRIVLKLSGEALAGAQGYGIDPETVETIAKQVVEVNKLGIQVAIVVGLARPVGQRKRHGPRIS